MLGPRGFDMYIYAWALTIANDFIVCTCIYMCVSKISQTLGFSTVFLYGKMCLGPKDLLWISSIGLALWIS